MNKNIILIAISLLFLVGSIIFSYLQKKNYYNSLNRVKQESIEVKEVASLQQLWKAKGIKKRIQRVIGPIAPAKKERVNFKRNKVDIKLNTLTDKELNRVLTKLSTLPLQFKKLKIVRSGDEFILECLCVW